jgi:hypothetical protein
LEEAQVGWDDESISLAAIEIAALSREPSLRDRKGAILQIIKYAGHLRSLGEQLRFVRQFAGASLSKTDLFLAASLAIGPLFTDEPSGGFLEELPESDLSIIAVAHLFNGSPDARAKRRFRQRVQRFFDENTLQRPSN